MLAVWVQRGWMWLFAALMIGTMSLSRVYLGVHFVPDVIAGFFISIFCLVLYLLWRRRWSANFSKRILGYRLMIAVMVPLLLTLLYVGVRVLIGEPDLSVSWAAFIPEAEREAIEAVVREVTLVLGAGLGFLMESSRIRFRASGLLWKRIARYLLGAAVAFAIWAGLGAAFPRDPLVIGLVFRFARYMILALWLTYYAPWLFVKIGLAKADPEPQITLTL